jgi:hypothetical protein
MDNGKELLEYMDQTRDYQMRSIYTDLELLQINHERVALYVMQLETLIRNHKIEGTHRPFDIERSMTHLKKALSYLKVAESLWQGVSAKTLIHLGDEEAIEELKTKIEECNK